eukprot:TRINITY_DN15694_c0_g2_i2.p1 TRINITY_DN15694_c0_g2~~TRINITY_DN15694_c0_g2_i2.p1  ORF type:complete len:267 (+),score=25.64 TRINITY_DN15694_c0_g2_i2:92-802(+)
MLGKCKGLFDFKTVHSGALVRRTQIFNKKYLKKTGKQNKLVRCEQNQNDSLSFQHLGKQALKETSNVLTKMSDDKMEEFLSMVMQANNICCLGVGREGLCMQGLAMRLFHLGLKCSYVGEMTAACLGAGDLLIVSAGPGFFPSVDAIATVAKNAGAKVLLFTSLQDSKMCNYANCTILIPARTMAEVEDEEYQSVLQLGSAYELALWTTFDILALLLQNRMNISDDQMSSRHTNME